MKRQKTSFNSSSFNKSNGKEINLDNFILDNEILDEIRDKWRPNLNYKNNSNNREDH